MSAGRNAGLQDRGRRFVEKHGWLHTILLVVGIVTVLAILGAIFIAAGNEPDQIYTDAEVAPVHSDLFATSLSRLVNAPLERGGVVTILNNGDEFLPALIETIDNAQRSINFLVYIWSDGEFSNRVLDALLRARTRGVAVRLLLDDFGSKEVPFWRFSKLKDAGGRVEKFRTLQFGKWMRVHRRNHRRAIVIDGEVGFTGGMAVADKWLGHGQDPDHWRDMMFKVTGPMAHSLQAAFVSSWAGSSGEILTGPDIYPDVGNQASGVERFIHFVNSPASDDYSMAEFFIVPILAARKSVFIVTPYFVPDNHLQSVLVKKASEGVDVRLLVPGKHIDNFMVRLSAQANYEELLKAGVKVYEYRPTFNHSKFMVIDRQWAIIGSPNLNYRSRQLDEENAIGILDHKLGEQLTASFLADLKLSDEIKLDEWRLRGFCIRTAQRLAQIFQKQS